MNGFSAQLTEGYQLIGFVPAVIEQLTCEIAGADLETFLRFGHGRVSALRNKCIERRDAAFRKKLSCDGEKDVRVIVACFVRDDCEDPFAGLDHVEGFSNDGCKRDIV